MPESKKVAQTLELLLFIISDRFNPKHYLENHILIFLCKFDYKLKNRIMHGRD